MEGKVLILDFGSQYTQLIARKVRELSIYCEIFPYNADVDIDSYVAILLSGSPYSVLEEDAPRLKLEIKGRLPLLAICYGAQYLSAHYGGAVLKSETREFGRAYLSYISDDPLFHNIDQGSQVWMSHSDSICDLPDNAMLLASTDRVKNVAYRFKGEETYGIQFHPEVYHSVDGKQLLYNFLVRIAKIRQIWTTENFVGQTLNSLKEKLSGDKVVLGLSGGVDSTVAAVLISRAIGENLNCIFVNNGLLRKGEFEQVIQQYVGMGLHVEGVDASKRFIQSLEGVTDPEEKRKTIGKVFIDVFEEASKKVDAVWLGQGTIYPDVIESISIKGPSATIKSHHNVGGLPDCMNLKVIEPLKSLFKDEVRQVGAELGISQSLIQRHPFPGPGLAIRILGEVTQEAIKTVQEADFIFVNALKKEGLYHDIWQAGAILLPVNSVGVMGDERTYEKCIVLRAVESRDGMTADWVDFPHKFLQKVSNEIINKVKHINRVVYDISSKPPATIEWE
ncbi:GMP synthase [glutamine-hydrolyzing] [Elysia marginata]|uniref:GMP synthase [glutamine-hydrolyzing] n=1 Tax=Elysia marginata TaxID=1093978 RepID=A0AAV4G6I8_9GAST|nr:GMP synthase [glutamine-hydrolyzing] [Elysia marginata]